MPEMTAQQYRDAQVAEYGQFVAVQQIFVNGALAFNPGDAVPTSHVERGVVLSEQVAKTTTKAGREAAAAVTDTPKG